MAETEPTVQVWNPDTEQIIVLPVRQAAAGMIAYARREWRPGTPARAEHERRAVLLLAEHGYDTRFRKIRAGGQSDG
jgi:hypothetical protein